MVTDAQQKANKIKMKKKTLKLENENKEMKLSNMKNAFYSTHCDFIIYSIYSITFTFNYQKKRDEETSTPDSPEKAIKIPKTLQHTIL